MQAPKDIIYSYVFIRRKQEKVGRQNTRRFRIASKEHIEGQALQSLRKKCEREGGLRRGSKA